MAPPSGLRGALLQPADIPGSPAGGGGFGLDNLTCSATATGAVEQVHVSYPIGPQSGPQPASLLNIVVRFDSTASAQAFMIAERTQLAACTMHAAGTTPPPQPGPPQVGDDATRQVYVDCQRFGCATIDYVFVRKANLVSVLINTSAAGSTLDLDQTGRFAQRSASLLAAVTQ